MKYGQFAINNLDATANNYEELHSVTLLLFFILLIFLEIHAASNNAACPF
jgi:hypothetical protein